MTGRKAYYAKMILFGEYTILKGSRVLAVPAEFHRARWDYASNKALQQDLPKLANWLHDLHKKGKLLFEFDSVAFLRELEKGLYLNSDIPIGYGLGSSGVVCAAVYEQFGINKVAPDDQSKYLKLKRHLAQIEHFFHGSSSGTDPFIAYINHAVLIEADGKVKKVKIPLPSEGESPFFLLDTGISRSTSPLVDLFLEKCKNENYNHRIIEELLPEMDQALDLLLSGKWNEMFEAFWAISKFQYQYFREMIPDSIQELWLKGLNSNDYLLKLCGAGGGGYLLGVSHSKQEYLSLNYPVRQILTV